jgi:hypothetical protein
MTLLFDEAYEGSSANSFRVGGLRGPGTTTTARPRRGSSILIRSRRWRATSVSVADASFADSRTKICDSSKFCGEAGCIMVRNARKPRAGVAGCAVAVAASLMSVPPAEAAPAVPAPAAPVVSAPAQVPMLGDALSQLSVFLLLSSNPPLQPVTRSHASDLSLFSFLRFFDIFALCQGARGRWARRTAIRR